jgi:hypothetical protein
MSATRRRDPREFPARLEVCTRDLDGVHCLGVLYRPTPDTVYCFRCGGGEPGVVYVREET